VVEATASPVSNQHVPDDDKPYWVAFKNVSGLGPVRFQRLLDTFGSMKAAWNADTRALSVVLDRRILELVVAQRRSLDVVGEFERLTGEGVEVITLGDDHYPDLLREIAAAPPVLFARGELVPTDRRAVAVVGTRRLTRYGKEMSEAIGRDLARAGVTVVSGLARGVDGIAHAAALEAGGRTIAVLGNGVRRVYPPEHRGLADKIVAQGAMLSEFHPDAPPDGPNFPARNRLISGLSLGVVVIEAPLRSGALITVDFAADQGRDVFAVPGSVASAASAGCLRILRDGARLVRDADDILEDLRLGEAPRQLAFQSVGDLDETSRRVLSVLTGEPRHIDEIAALADVDIGELSSLLMTLELGGTVRNVGAQYYARSR
jgi:DNA processing protein